MIRESVAWLIVDPIGRSGSFQMAADDLLADSISLRAEDAVLRFYTWDPPAVSLGFHQPIESIDTNSCSQLGWQIVRRPTGGRALLHAGDLCYSIVLAASDDPISRLHALYETVADAFVHSLRYIGIEAVTGSVRINDSRSNLRGTRLCLNSHVRGEVMVDGKKIIGSAQRIYRASILQHGSILLDGDPGAISKVIKGDDRVRNRLSGILRQQACSLAEITDKDFDPSELIQIFTHNICNRLKLDTFTSSWTDNELTQIKARQAQFSLTGESVVSRGLHFVS